MSKENTKTEETASVDPRLVGMPEQKRASQLADDMGLVTARLIIQVLLEPRCNDRQLAAAWCRLCVKLDNVDVRHHFAAAFDVPVESISDGTGETPDDGGES